MKNINSKDVVEKIVKKTSMTKKQANDVLNIILDTIKEEVHQGNKVSFRNFGSFFMAHREGRTGRNPQTGEAIEIPSMDMFRFKASKKLRK